MELNFSGFFTWVGIDIFYFNDLWNILNDLDQSINLIDFNNIDKLLLEELHQFSIHLGLKLWIFKSNSF